MSQLHTRQFANGVTLVAESIPGVQSLALKIMTGGGVGAEPAAQSGIAPLLAEMLCRGAGDLDAKAHSDALDLLGVQRGSGVDSLHLRVSATMIHHQLPAAWPLLCDMLRRPRLEADALEPARDLALQDLDALEDEPQQKTFIELRQKHYPAPFNRSPLGTRAALEALTIKDLQAYWQQAVRPGDCIVGVAGKFDFSQLCDLVEAQLGDWQGAATPLAMGSAPTPSYHHLKAESTQVHIGIAYDAVPETDERSILQRTAAAVLSGGMSGRLFTEVREKRGLCYSVYASYAANRQFGVMLSYAGTTVARAQETLDVLAGELRRLSAGIEEAEFQRAIVGMKSRLVMQGESTAARAGAIASDQYTFGRPRPLEELIALVDGVTLERADDFVRQQPAGAMSIVTIGPQPLTPPR